MVKNKFKELYSYKDIFTGLNIFIFFSIFYLILFFTFKYFGFISPYCSSDECRYFIFAENLMNGFYSPPFPNIDLSGGPGYPLFILPFKFIGFQKDGIIIINLFLAALTVCFTFFASRILIPYRLSIFISSIWGFYYIHYPELFSAHTEVLASILLLTSFHYYLLFTKNNKKYYLYLSGFLLGFLALTKVIFAFVILLLLIIATLISFFKKRTLSIFIVASIAFLTTVPYQIYTLQLTGRPFYFSNIGGVSLYWMSTPFKYEYGEGNNSIFDVNCNNIEKEIPCNKKLYAKNHGLFFEKINSLPPLLKNDALIAQAKKNIKNNPIKYLRNISSNISRMFFNIPNSYFYQRDITTTFRLFPNSILFTLILFSSLITVFNLKKIPQALRHFIGITFIYLFLSSLLSAFPRMLNISIPLILIWISYTLKYWKESA